MARIRTIKPEFPQSESMGRVSREARLLFILLWTICDDAGRARASSRMLASLLYPYDDDAPTLIERWLCELEAEGCVRRYAVDGNTYIDVPNWLKHQKIDKPSQSRFPEFVEASRIVASPREASALDLGPRKGPVARTLDLGPSTADQGAPIGAGLFPPGVDVVPSEESDEAEAVQRYNAVAEQFGWSRCQDLTPARRKQLRARLKKVGGLSGWIVAMEKAAASPYLRGETKRAEGYEDWCPDLDFFVQASKFTKLLEGKYDARGTVNGRGGVMEAGRRVLQRLGENPNE